MKKVSLLVGIVFSVALLVPVADAGNEVYSRNVVGYYDIELTGGVTNLNLVAFPFRKIPAASGLISDNTAEGAEIVVDGAGWAVDQFAAGAVGQEATGASTFYIEITSGALEGRHAYIASNTEDTLTIAGGLEDVSAGELEDSAFAIVAANRIRDLFGEPGDPKLEGGISSDVADTVIVWHGTGYEAPIFYQTTDLFGNPVEEWRQGGVNVADLVIDRDQAVFIRRQGAKGNLSVVGEVSQNAQQIILESERLNLVGGLSVVEEQLGLSMTNTLSGGISSDVADTILVWHGTGYEAPIFFQTTDLFGNPINEWRQGGVAVDFSFEPTRGYFIRVQDDPVGPWVRQSPLAGE